MLLFCETDLPVNSLYTAQNNVAKQLDSQHADGDGAGSEDMNINWSTA
jgi:hypothetical protein